MISLYERQGMILRAFAGRAGHGSAATSVALGHGHCETHGRPG